MTSPCPAPSHRGHTITYAHRLNGRDYSFAFELVDMRTAEGWRLYILDQPGYGQWADGCHETHRHLDRQSGLHYICIAQGRQPVATVAEAKGLARLWAEGTARYIDTGRGF